MGVVYNALLMMVTVTFVCFTMLLKAIFERSVNEITVNLVVDFILTLFSKYEITSETIERIRTLHRLSIIKKKPII